MVDLATAIPALVVVAFLLRAVVIIPLEFRFLRMARVGELGDTFESVVYGGWGRRVLGPHMLNIPAVLLVVFIASYAASVDLCGVNEGLNACVLNPSYAVVASVIGWVVGSMATIGLLAGAAWILTGFMQDVRFLHLAVQDLKSFYGRQRSAQTN